jgi:LuxR family maltose regulon positive regulatory protein
MVEAAEYLAAAESAAAADAGLTRQIAGPVAAHRAYLHFFAGAFPAAHQEAALALSLLPAGEAVLRARAAVVLSSVLRFAGQLQAAETALLPLRDTIATASVYTATLHYATLGEIQQEQGQLHQAMETFGQALAFAARATGRPDTPFTGFAYIAIGHVQRMWNELETAATAITRGLALCREWRQAEALAIGLIELAELEQSRGEFALAQEALDELRQIVATMGSPWGQAQAQVAQARLDLARGDMVAVEHWVRTSGVSADAVAASTGFDDLQTFGQVLVARGDPAGAARLFERLAEQFRTAGCVDRLLPALVWWARALAELGRRDQALAVLGEALALGEPGGYVRVFVAGGLPVATLLETQSAMRNAQRDSLHGYVEHLLAAFHTGSHGASVSRANAAASDPLPEPLNPRELVILRLMAAGLSNQAIGAELVLSVNTVRWYASQLFAKLDVSGRGAAVARARELGLLP